MIKQNIINSSVRSLLLAGATLGAVSFSSNASAQLALEPNLTPFPAFDVQVAINLFTGEKQLRFSTRTWNNGLGPLHLEAGDVVTGQGTDLQKVNQRIWLDDGTSFLHFAGQFDFHPEHNHMHFNDYAVYTNIPQDAPGGSEQLGAKTTFCVMDTDKIDTSLPNAPSRPQYTTCGNQAQGMSVGYADTYGYHLAGQELALEDNPDGIYKLVIEVDPKDLIIESNESDNVSCLLYRIDGGTNVTILDDSGTCSGGSGGGSGGGSDAWGISPDSADIGTFVNVEITGVGFSQNTTIEFRGGNGPRPVASNILLASDTETTDVLTATITVPYKRKAGNRPVWDVYVGNIVLEGAFTVTEP